MIIPYPVDELTHVLAWQTDILKAWNGTEHRAAILSGPRESLDLGYLLDDDQDDQAIHAIRAALFADPAGTYQFPLWHEGLAIQGDAGGGATVTVSSTYADWLNADQAVLLIGPDPSVYFTGTISSADKTVPTAAVITLSGTPAAMIAGYTHLYPLVTVVLPDGQPMVRWRLDGGLWRTGGMVSDPFRTYGTGASLTSYGGLTVLDEVPLGVNRAEEQIRGAIEIHDYGAVIAASSSVNYSDIHRSHEFHINGDADRQYWKKFLATVRGRQRAFLLPTWRDDLIAAANPAGTALLVASTPSYIAWFSSLAHKRLQIELADGSVNYRTASGVVNNGDGTHTVTLTASITGTVEKISLLEQCRLANDEVTVEYGKSCQGSIAFGSLVVQQ